MLQTVPAMETLLADALTRLVAVVSAPVDPASRLHWPYLVTFVLLGGLAWALHARGSGRGPLRWLFDRRIWLHPSARVDYQIWAFNRFVGPVALIGSTVSAAAVASWLALRLGASFPRWGGVTWTAWTTAVFTGAYFVVNDFGGFLNHWLHHRVPWLWPFHAVHHSAEVLTPFTLYRKHPLYDLSKHALRAGINGVFTGLVVFAFQSRPDVVTLLGLNAAYAAFQLAGGNLRHSHAWLHWGSVLGRLFISPAQHQVHHSLAERHRDRNFGTALALWDWLFGTLYLPEGVEELEFGLPEGNEHGDLGRALVLPFAQSWRALRGG